MTLREMKRRVLAVVRTADAAGLTVPAIAETTDLTEAQVRHAGFSLFMDDRLEPISGGYCLSVRRRGSAARAS